MTRTAKSILILALSAGSLPTIAAAQQGYPPPQYAQYAMPFKPGVELAGFAGYHLASDLNYASGHAAIDGSASYGAALRFKPRPGESVELMWTYVPTTAHFVSTFLAGGIGDASLTINYFQLGGTKSFRNDRIEPYFAASMGAALYSVGDLRVAGATQLRGGDLWRFAFTVGVGTKIWLAEQVAIQLEARMLAPVWFSSAAFYAGPAGAAFGVAGGIPIVEGNFTGGLVLAL